MSEGGELRQPQYRGVLAWFARNTVAANLAMVTVIIGGLLSLKTIKIEFFPEMSLDVITITVPYLGASPSEVEQGVTLRIEEAVASVDGIKRLNSSSVEGVSVVTLELEENADASEVLDDVKAEVNRIITFPEETEKPIISEIKMRYQVLTVVLYGDVSERTLKELAEDVKDDLTVLPNISQVDVGGVRPYEISIEVSEETLRKYGLSFDQVTAAVRGSSLDIPGGSVKTAGGEILVRTKGQRYTGKEFEEIVVLTRTDGTKIRLRDIATVIDGFEDSDVASRFDGKPAALVRVFRIGDQDALEVADAAKKYVAERRHNLPEGVSIDIWEDSSEVLRSRINLLKEDGIQGLILMFVSLFLFLDFKLAFWTTLAIPVTFLGTVLLMPTLGVSINMISLFAFLMVLGVVDDTAIVIGDSVFEYRRRGLKPLAAAVAGVQEMAIPVFISVLTTQMAFVPLYFISGIMGKFMRVIPIVAITAVTITMLDSLFLLPAHLSHGKLRPLGPRKGIVGRCHGLLQSAVDRFVAGPFSWLVGWTLRNRYVTAAVSICVLLGTAGLVQGGFVKFTFFHRVEGDNMIATLTMPQGTPPEETEKILRRLEDAAFQVRDEYDARRPGKPSLFRHMSTTIGDQPVSRRRGPVGGPGGVSRGHLGEVNVELLGSEDRDVSSVAMTNRWRTIVGEVAGVSSLTFQAEIFSAGDAINVELSHEDFNQLLAAADDLKRTLRDYSGVTDIADSFDPGKVEIKLSLTDAGRTLGLTLGDLARQARQGFYGDEAQRVQRGKHDVRVMVRYPLSERRSLSDIENMRIRLPGGQEIPFSTVARVEYGRGYADIQRAERRRVVNVTADVDAAAANADEINANLLKDVLPDLEARYPGLKHRFAGEQRERQESFGTLYITFPLVLVALYGLLAVQFRSYVQSFVVMSVVPFGIVGAVLGHMLLGYDLGLLSFCGIVALSGIVVDNSVILIDAVNRERRDDVPVWQTVRDTTARRFRPIVLTSLTTSLGVLPLVLEKSLQARFMVPMAISLGCGVAFATLITLLLTPSLYLVVEDIKTCVLRSWTWLRGGQAVQPTAGES